MKKKVTLALTLSLLLFSWNCFAGNGTYTDSTPDLIDLHVMFMYDEPCFAGANCTDWEKLFEEASKLLYDGTEKQVKFSEIYFYNNCPKAANKADVKIYNDTQGANAHVGGLANTALSDSQNGHY